MKISILSFLLISVLSVPIHKHSVTHLLANNVQTKNDTLIGSKIITNEIAGSNYRSRAKAYFVITNKDTSAFNCIFTESKERKKVGIELRFDKSSTYAQRLNQLKLILPEAAKEFNLDSLRSFFIGRLILHGDLAVVVTKEYQKQFGKDTKIGEYKIISKFLVQSKLASDLNALLKPYSISVKTVSPEKVFFTEKKVLFSAAKIETDAAEVPDKILDCLIYVGFKNN